MYTAESKIEKRCRHRDGTAVAVVMLARRELSLDRRLEQRPDRRQDEVPEGDRDEVLDRPERVRVVGSASWNSSCTPMMVSYDLVFIMPLNSLPSGGTNLPEPPGVLRLRFMRPA
jgi:hypothetical protein